MNLCEREVSNSESSRFLLLDLASKRSRLGELRECGGDNVVVVVVRERRGGNLVIGLPVRKRRFWFFVVADPVFVCAVGAASICVVGFVLQGPNSYLFSVCDFESSSPCPESNRILPFTSRVLYLLSCAGRCLRCVREAPCGESNGRLDSARRAQPAQAGIRLCSSE